MSGKIVLPYDGSMNANMALLKGLELAKLIGTSVVVLNVQPNIETIHTRRFFAKDDIQEFIQESGQETLQKAIGTLDKSGVSYELLVRAGDAKREITQYAKDIDASYIVMGSRGMGTVVKNIIGSVSVGVISLAHCPVVVVPE